MPPDFGIARSSNKGNLNGNCEKEHRPEVHGPQVDRSEVHGPEADGPQVVGPQVDAEKLGEEALSFLASLKRPGPSAPGRFLFQSIFRGSGPGSPKKMRLKLDHCQ